MQWAKTLHSSDIEKIELVCLLNSESEQYYLYHADEYSWLTDLVNGSHGQRLWFKPKKEFLEGPMTYLYITTKDGVRHSFVNCKNNYVVIDGEIYDATKDWLTEWDFLPGNSSVPEGFWEEPGILSPGYIYSSAGTDNVSE